MRCSASVASLVVAWAVGAVAAQQVAGVREMPYAPNRTIAERLLAEDEVVVVTMRGDDVVSPGRPTAEAMASVLLRDYVAVLFEITEAEGVLVDDGRWIDSKFSGTVIDRLSEGRGKSTELFAKGTHASVSMHGGSLRMGKVLVKTDRRADLNTGHTYVIFLGELDSWQRLPMVAHPPLMVQPNGTLHAPPPAASALEGLSLARLRRLARSR